MAKRDQVISTRLTIAERQELEERAVARGLTLTDLVRALLAPTSVRLSMATPSVTSTSSALRYALVWPNGQVGDTYTARAA